MIACVACTCGSVDKLIRGKLEFFGYRDFLTIPIVRGKDKSKSALNSLPQSDGIEMLRAHLDKCSKFAVVIGYDDNDCRWVDIANGKAVQNNIELEMLLNRFA